MCLKIQDLVVLDLLGGEHPLWSRVPLQRELSPFSLTVPYGRCPEIPKYQSRLTTEFRACQRNFAPKKLGFAGPKFAWG